jgi:hypothetical protein
MKPVVSTLGSLSGLALFAISIALATGSSYQVSSEKASIEEHPLLSQATSGECDIVNDPSSCQPS